MANLEEARQQIDEIDRQMTELFEQRMAAVANVALYKQKHNLPVLHPAREEEVVAKGTARLRTPALAPYYASFIRHTMGLSRQYQTQILGQNVVAYQGAQGGFGHSVAGALFPLGSLLATPTFEGVFNLVENGEAAYGVVPFENSTTGDVSGILDLCQAHSCYVTAMYDLPVTQNLLALPGATLGDIKTVVSHPQALEQSKRFLQSLGAAQKPYANTATAAQYVAATGDKTIAAIASLEAAELYGLVPLAQNIATEASNATRFIVLSKQMPTLGDRFSLLVTIENKVGQLAKIIEIISAHGFDMENIKSRPQPHRPWEYYFYIELVGAQNTAEAQNMLASLAKTCLSVRLLGIYHRAAPNAQKI
ncbi:chorismate mutase [Ruminococcaceae bacterium OttesenSCG-928-A16]|nr:chorismate mutase [Ruminococcaceae bacterium OttesenSCG-928-A16]